MMYFDITEREKDRFDSGMCRGAHSIQSHVKSVLLSFSNIVTHNHNYQEFINITTLTTFTLFYKFEDWQIEKNKLQENYF